MKRLTSLGNGLKGLSKISASLMVAAAFGATACDEGTTYEDAGVDPELGVNFDELGTPLTTCTAAGTSDYSTTTKVLTVSVPTDTDAVVSVVNGKLKINGHQCVTTAVPPLELTSSNVSRLNITTVDNGKVVLDLLPGTFGNLFAGTAGIVITGTTANLSVGVRGTALANIVKMSEVAGTVSAPQNYYLELSGDTRADVKIVPFLSSNPPISFALGDGADSFTAQGQSLTITALGTGTQGDVNSSQALTVFGGAGNDTLKGGLGNDTLNGGDGNDVFQTNATTATVTTDGSDTYIGGTGTDTVDYSGRTEAVNVSIAPTETNGWVKGVNVFDVTVASGAVLTYTASPASSTTFTFLANATGPAAIEAALDAGLVGATASINDRGELIIRNSTAAAILVATGGAGTTLFGSASESNNATTQLLADPDDGKALEADDVRGDVENVTGGSGDDVLTGSDSANLINGGAGADNIAGGIAGSSCTGATADTDSLNGGDGNDIFQMGFAANCSDILDGGAGSDMANYEMRALAVNIDIDGTADDGDVVAVEADNIKTTVEGVMGGEGDDTIIGSTGNDDLHGGIGLDTISGGTGADTLTGGLGVDSLIGGAGEDFFNEKSSHDTAYVKTSILAGGAGDLINGGADLDKADFFRSATMTITLCASTNLTGTGACVGDTADSQESDDLTNIEYFVGGSGADSIIGSSADDIIEGGGDADTITGGAGNDTLYGEAGSDVLSGEAGDDTLDGAAGTNVLTGGAGDDLCTLGAAGSTKDITCEI